MIPGLSVVKKVVLLKQYYFFYFNFGVSIRTMEFMLFLLFVVEKGFRIHNQIVVF
jgi:hypothetical protein